MAFKRIALGMAIGYVLGAKTGEKRLEQLGDRWKDFIESDRGKRLLEGGRQFAEGPGWRALTVVRDRATGNRGQEQDEDVDDEDYEEDDEESYQGDRRAPRAQRDEEDQYDEEAEAERSSRFSQFVTATIERGRVD